MVKSKSTNLRKACFGTKEWSENSGICKRCNLRKSCGKAREKLLQ